MLQLSRIVHAAIHLAGMALALIGIAMLPSAVAPWVCLASHGAGAFTHRLEATPGRDTEFLGIIRVSLGIVACLVSAGQHWVVGVTGPEYLALAALSLGLELVRPAAAKRG